MGERCNRTAEVWGSIPHSSTIQIIDFSRFSQECLNRLSSRKIR
jgi:hypothetical protein